MPDPVYLSRSHTDTPDPGHPPCVISARLIAPTICKRFLWAAGSAAPLRTLSVSTRLRGRSLVEDIDLAPEEILDLLDTASRLKRMQKRGESHTYLPGKTLGMIFQHPSTRTRVSFEAGMAQLGGTAIFLGVNDLQLSRGETTADTAPDHRTVMSMPSSPGSQSTRMSRNLPLMLACLSSMACPTATIPTQALADLLTLQEHYGKLNGLKVAYFGDSNNTAASLMLDCAATGVSLTIACPPGLRSG